MTFFSAMYPLCHFPSRGLPLCNIHIPGIKETVMLLPIAGCIYAKHLTVNFKMLGGAKSAVWIRSTSSRFYWLALIQIPHFKSL